jgi:predicted lipoprotein with Yx(FWY)xxD motif
MFRGIAVQVMDIRRALAWMAAIAAIAAAGCGSGGGGGNQPPLGQATNIGLSSSASLGNYLVSSDGRTLYYFGFDFPAGGGQPPVSNCTGGCVALWPVFHVDTPDVAAGLSASDFGEITRTDGAKQTTYKGWPLYFFSGDAKAGDTNGDNLEAWYVLRDPFYSALVVTKSIAGTPIYLADAAGRTLYVFSGDTVGAAGAPPVSNCTGACLTIWQIFVAGSTIVPTGVNPNKVTTFTRADGAMQSAFDGHPLYYFSGDTLPGDTKGSGFQGVWETVDPSSL